MNVVYGVSSSHCLQVVDDVLERVQQHSTPKRLIQQLVKQQQQQQSDGAAAATAVAVHTPDVDKALSLSPVLTLYRMVSRGHCPAAVESSTSS